MPHAPSRLSYIAHFNTYRIPIFGAAAIGTFTKGCSSSIEMQRIFQEDQSARQKPASSKLEGMNIYRQDAARRAAVHKLLDDGALHGAQDFEYASFIFQHSDNADDYLLAHTLATYAIATQATNRLLRQDSHL